MKIYRPTLLIFCFRCVLCGDDGKTLEDYERETAKLEEVSSYIEHYDVEELAKHLQFATSKALYT